MRIRRTIQRSGFTLVELLVATALILFIMAIIAQMFGSGSKTFSNMRNAAHLSSNARTGINVIRMDLSREKFGSPTNPRGGPYVMNQRLDQTQWEPPAQGYFELFQGDPPVIFEPGTGSVADGEGIYSTRAGFANSHRMRFTMKLSDQQTAPADLLCAQYHPRLAIETGVNLYTPFAPTIYSQWAEVAYFTMPNGSMTPTNLPLFTLHRRVRLLPSQNSDEYYLTPAEDGILANDILLNTYPDVIQPINIGPNGNGKGKAKGKGKGLLNRWVVPGPESLNDPNSDTYTARIPWATHPNGDDILLTNVLSFEIKAAWYYNPLFNATA